MNLQNIYKKYKNNFSRLFFSKEGSIISFFLIICVFISLFYYRSVQAEEKSITDLDSDGDGLTDIAEREKGTDPLKPDTDGDGYTDYIEIRTGYDPLKPAPGDKIDGSESSTSTETNISDLEDDSLGRGDLTTSDDVDLSDPNSDSYFNSLFGEYFQSLDSQTNMTEALTEGGYNLNEYLTENGGQFNFNDVNSIVDGVISEDDLTFEMPEIKDSDLIILNETNSENLKTYLLAFNLALANNTPIPDEDVTELVLNQNLSIISKYSFYLLNNDEDFIHNSNIKFKNLFEDLIQIPVPNEALSIHKRALRSSLALSEILEGMESTKESDYISFLIKAQNLLYVYENEKDFFDEAITLQEKYDIQLNEKETF